MERGRDGRSALRPGRAASRPRSRHRRGSTSLLGWCSRVLRIRRRPPDRAAAQPSGGRPRAPGRPFRVHRHRPRDRQLEGSGDCGGVGSDPGGRDGGRAVIRVRRCGRAYGLGGLRSRVRRFAPAPRLDGRAGGGSELRELDGQGAVRRGSLADPGVHPGRGRFSGRVEPAARVRAPRNTVRALSGSTEPQSVPVPLLPRARRCDLGRQLTRGARTCRGRDRDRAADRRDQATWAQPRGGAGARR